MEIGICSIRILSLEKSILDERMDVFQVLGSCVHVQCDVGHPQRVIKEDGAEGLSQRVLCFQM